MRIHEINVRARSVFCDCCSTSRERLDEVLEAGNRGRYERVTEKGFLPEDCWDDTGAGGEGADDVRLRC